MVHWGPADALVTPDVTTQPGIKQAQDLVTRLTKVLPGIAPVQPDAARVTIRPIPRDGLSAVGPIPNLAGYYVVVTHSGVTLSPALGEIVADEIMTGTDQPELASVPS
jgi:glycine/D-amino acid oxidase-like deaminating enzyme